MHDTTAVSKATPQGKPRAGRNDNPRYAKLYRSYPTVDYLRRAARRRLPHFAFEYSDGGSGKDDAGIRRNWAALDAVELVPRYGVMPSLPPCEIELFGTRYAAPIGIAPMGGPAIVWPGADLHLARAAQRARIPYTLGTVGCATIEQIAEAAPDVFWFQLYRAARNDHAIGFDLVRRAQAAGCRALMLTLDVPVRTTRAREVVVGLGGAFTPDVKMMAQMAMSPAWSMALWKNGIPRFANLRTYGGANASIADMVAFARREMGGAFTWEEVARYGPLERSVDRQGRHASAGRRQGRVARSRRHVRFEPRRPAGRGVAGADRCPAGHRAPSRQPSHRDAGFRYSKRHRCGSRLCARRCRGVRRQGVLVGTWRAGRRGPRPRDRSFDRRDPVRARTIGRADAAKVALGRDPASRGIAVLIPLKTVAPSVRRR